MRNRSALRAIASLVLVTASFVAATDRGSSASHPWQDVYITDDGDVARWHPNYKGDINFRHEPGVANLGGGTTGKFASRIIYGALAWDNLDQSLNFDHYGQVAAGVVPHSCLSGPDNESVVYNKTIDGPHGTWAENHTCSRLFGGTRYVYKFWQYYDTTESWYNGTSEFPPNPSYADAWSAAAHELGHATGWGKHFNEAYNTTCPNQNHDPARQTMCGGIRQYDTAQRSPSTHDIYAFNGAY